MLAFLGSDVVLAPFGSLHVGSGVGWGGRLLWALKWSRLPLAPFLRGWVLVGVAPFFGLSSGLGSLSSYKLFGVYAGVIDGSDICRFVPGAQGVFVIGSSFIMRICQGPVLVKPTGAVLWHWMDKACVRMVRCCTQPARRLFGKCLKYNQVSRTCKHKILSVN